MLNNAPFRVVVFASSFFAQNILSFLAKKNILVGVIMPDPSELDFGAEEVNNLAAQLQSAAIPFQCCCKEMLPLICEQMEAWQANLALSVTYPQLFPDEIRDYFFSEVGLGIYNVHGSNLPSYAGPCPIYWQIRNKETETAVVLHRIEKEVDGGNIVGLRAVNIDPLDTLPSLTNRLAFESSSVVAEMLKQIESTACPLQGVPQPRIGNKRVAPRPKMNDYLVDFKLMSAQDIAAMCRAGNGVSYSTVISINGVDIDLVQATPVDNVTYGTKPGTIVFIGDPEGLIICVKNGALRLDILAGADGIYSGLAFSERFHLDAGASFDSSSLLKSQVGELNYG